MTTDPFLPPDEQRFYDGVVHSLRSRGWSRTDAEDTALERLIDRRAALAAIIETQRADAELAAWAHLVPPDGGSPTPEECALAETIATAIRTGTHYGKAEQ